MFKTPIRWHNMIQVSNLRFLYFIFLIICSFKYDLFMNGFINTFSMASDVLSAWVCPVPCSHIYQSMKQLCWQRTHFQPEIKHAFILEHPVDQTVLINDHLGSDAVKSKLCLPAKLWHVVSSELRSVIRVVTGVGSLVQLTGVGGVQTGHKAVVLQHLELCWLIKSLKKKLLMNYNFQLNMLVEMI